MVFFWNELFLIFCQCFQTNKLNRKAIDSKLKVKKVAHFRKNHSFLELFKENITQNNNKLFKQLCLLI